MMWLFATLLLIVLAGVEVAAFLAIPRMAKKDHEWWLQTVLGKEPTAYTVEEYITECIFEFIIFNAGILIGIALGAILARAI